MGLWMDLWETFHPTGSQCILPVLALCVDGRRSAPRDSRKRCGSCRVVPSNSFVNRSPMEMSGIAGKWGELMQSQKHIKALQAGSPSSYRQGD